MTMIERARQINGWQLDTEIEWLAYQALHHETILEIGSYCGRSSFALASHMTKHDNPLLVCLDDWRGEVDRPGLEGVALFNQWSANLKAYEFAMPFAVDSTHLSDDDIAELTAEAEGGFSMVFIDGSHDTESVIADCKLADKVAATGALICGHDYFAPDVRAAVYHHYVAGQGRKVTNPAGSIWMVE